MNEGRSYLHLVQDQAHDGAFNMAVDEFLLKSQIQKKDLNSILRFYRFNEPTITVGYGMWQAVHTKMNSQIPFVRRITGGGMVVHGRSDLTYSLVVPLSRQTILKRVKESYHLIHEELRRALGHFGIATELFEKKYNAVTESDAMCKTERISFCFDSPVLFDVMLSGKKIAGGGQKRTQSYLLHQGSIAWNLLTEAFPNLVESDFCSQFAACLGGLLDLPIKGIPFYAEEVRELAGLILHG